MLLYKEFMSRSRKRSILISIRDTQHLIILLLFWNTSCSATSCSIFTILGVYGNPAGLAFRSTKTIKLGAHMISSCNKCYCIYFSNLQSNEQLQSIGFRFIMYLPVGGKRANANVISIKIWKIWMIRRFIVIVLSAATDDFDKNYSNTSSKSVIKCISAFLLLYLIRYQIILLKICVTYLIYLENEALQIDWIHFGN